MEQGSLEYDTPHGKTVFTAGSGGFVNSNVLHMSRAKEGEGSVAALLHIFNPLLISGQSGSIIDRKYVSPLMTASHVEIIEMCIRDRCETDAWRRQVSLGFYADHSCGQSLFRG